MDENNKNHLQTGGIPPILRLSARRLWRRFRKCGILTLALAATMALGSGANAGEHYYDADTQTWNTGFAGGRLPSADEAFIVSTGEAEINGVIQNYLQSLGPLGSIERPSTLTKTGDGTLELSGDNTYTGGSTVDGGTLILSGNNTGYGGLLFNGAVVNNGATLIVEGTNTGSGNTVINEGNFTLGENGTIGAGNLVLTNNGLDKTITLDNDLTTGHLDLWENTIVNIKKDKTLTIDDATAIKLSLTDFGIVSGAGINFVDGTYAFANDDDYSGNLVVSGLGGDVDIDVQGVVDLATILADGVPSFSVLGGGIGSGLNIGLDGNGNFAFDVNETGINIDFSGLQYLDVSDNQAGGKFKIDIVNLVELDMPLPGIGGGEGWVSKKDVSVKHGDNVTIDDNTASLAGGGIAAISVGNLMGGLMGLLDPNAGPAFDFANMTMGNVNLEFGNEVSISGNKSKGYNLGELGGLLGGAQIPAFGIGMGGGIAAVGNGVNITGGNDVFIDHNVAGLKGDTDIDPDAVDNIGIGGGIAALAIGLDLSDDAGPKDAKVTLGDDASISHNSATLMGGGAALVAVSGESRLVLGDRATVNSNATSGDVSLNTITGLVTPLLDGLTTDLVDPDAWYGGIVNGLVGVVMDNVVDPAVDYVTNNNFAIGGGAAVISLSNDAEFTVGSGSFIGHNTAGAPAAGNSVGIGGAAAVIGLDTHINIGFGSTIESNRATAAGGAFVAAGLLSSNVRIDGDTYFSDNIAGGKGGALYIVGLKNTVDLNTGLGSITFRGNKQNAEFDSKGIFVDGEANSLYLQRGTTVNISGNHHVFFDDPIASADSLITGGGNSLVKTGKGFVQFSGDNVLNHAMNYGGRVDVREGEFRVTTGSSFTSSGLDSILTVGIDLLADSQLPTWLGYLNIDSHELNSLVDNVSQAAGGAVALLSNSSIVDSGLTSLFTVGRNAGVAGDGTINTGLAFHIQGYISPDSMVYDADKFMTLTKGDIDASTEIDDAYKFGKLTLNKLVNLDGAEFRIDVSADGKLHDTVVAQAYTFAGAQSTSKVSADFYTAAEFGDSVTTGDVVVSTLLPLDKEEFHEIFDVGGLSRVTAVFQTDQTMQLQLDKWNVAMFGKYLGTNNMQKMGELLDDAFATGQVDNVKNYYYGITDDQVMFDALTSTLGGELVASSQTMALWRPWRMTNSRLYEKYENSVYECSCACDPKWNFWFEGYYNHDNFDRTSDALSAKMTRGGLMLGADRRVADWLTLGFAFSYGSPKISSAAGRVEANDYTFGLYTQMQLTCDIYMNAFVGYGTQSYDYTRNGYRGESSYDGDSMYASLEFFRPIHFNTSVLYPLIAVDFQKSWTDGFRENTSSSMPLLIQDGSMDQTVLRVGVNWKYFYRERLDLRVRAQYGYLIAGDHSGEAMTSFANVRPGNTRTLAGVTRGPGMLNLGVGFEWYLNDAKNLRLYGDYDLDLANKSTGHTGQIGLGYHW